MEFKKLGINIADADDRSAVFKRICELLSLNAEKVAEKLEIAVGRNGFELSSNQLLIFCVSYELHGVFDFRKNGEGNNFVIFVPELPSVGRVAVEAPETIKETSVDSVKVAVEAPVTTPPAEPTLESDFQSVGTGAPEGFNHSALVEPEQTEEAPESMTMGGEAPEEVKPNALTPLPGDLMNEDDDESPF